jgi:deoxyribodipyrimidine photolyase-related protein
MNILRPILADQLSYDLASLADLDLVNDRVVFCEVRTETDYVFHHPQKIIFLFSAMRHFANALMAMGIQVTYVTLDDPENTQSLISEWQRLSKRFGMDKIVVTEPGEWRLREAFINADLEMREDTRFLCTHQQFQNWAHHRKQLRMEYFYQMMRQHHQVLLTNDGKPQGGKWNYDVENREPLKGEPRFPKRLVFNPDEITQSVIALVRQYFAHHFGAIESFNYAVTHEDAQQHVTHFFKTCLPHFGQYQDVMMTQEVFLSHGVLSMYLNAGLLNPLVLCQQAQLEFEEGRAPLSAVEGFIRQILGWREYVRGIYWLNMPDYAQLNALHATRPLPELYWGGKTNMNCMATVVKQTQLYAYSHHIQRLMITGNFALLAGLEPKAVCEWYLAVYLDAYEWVELPNTLGMALYADGGCMASKPYAASASYINKMSNFCESCVYNPKKVVGENACPFNSLYWDFIARHEDKLKSNMRMKFMYATWHRFDEDKKASILHQAKQYFELLALNQL